MKKFFALGSFLFLLISSGVALAQVTDTQAPATPTNLTGYALGSTSTYLSWASSTDNVAVTGYNIYRNNMLIGQNILATSTATSSAVVKTSYTDNGLTSGASYIYAVSAFDAAGNVSGQSSSLAITTPVQATYDIVAASILSPYDLQGQWPIAGHDMTWQFWISNTGTATAVASVLHAGVGRSADSVLIADGFVNVPSIGPNQTVNVTWTTTAPPNISSTVTNDYYMTGAADYYNVVVPEFSENNNFIQKSFYVAVRNPASITPTNLQAPSVSRFQISLSWTSPADTFGLKGYNVYRGAIYYPKALIGTTTSTSYIDYGLDSGTAYTYSIAGKYLTGTGPETPTLSVSTSASVYSIGIRIKTVYNLNVRKSAGSNAKILGAQPTGALGTITGGPTKKDGYTWWNVNFDTGVDGWVVQDISITNTMAALQPLYTSAFANVSDMRSLLDALEAQVRSILAQIAQLRTALPAAVAQIQ